MLLMINCLALRTVIYSGSSFALFFFVVVFFQSCMDDSDDRLFGFTKGYLFGKQFHAVFLHRCMDSSSYFMVTLFTEVFLSYVYRCCLNTITEMYVSNF